jgi:hypothetical protein
VRGGRPAIKQPRCGKDVCSGTPGQDQRIVLGVLPNVVEERPILWSGDAVHLRHDDDIGAAPKQRVQFSKREVRYKINCSS